MYLEIAAADRAVEVVRGRILATVEAWSRWGEAGERGVDDAEEVLRREAAVVIQVGGVVTGQLRDGRR